MKASSEDLRQKIVGTFTLLAVLVVALFLRAYQLDAESLWLDEAYAVHMADNSFIQVLRLSFPDGNPPLYYLLLHYWQWLFGDSELSVRIPSVLFGGFSVALIYKVGALLFGRVTGFIGALIMALSAYQLHYAQEARTYSMMVFLALSSSYLFLRLFGGKNYWVLAGYVLSSAALMYSQYHGIFIVFAQALFVLGFYSLNRHNNDTPTRRTWANAPTFRTWALAAGAIGIVYIPGFFYLAYPLVHSEHRSHLHSPGLNDLLWSFLQYAGAPNFPSPLLLAMLTLFAVIAVGVLAKKGGDRKTLSLLLLWLIVPIAFPFVLSHVITPLYDQRYSIAALPAFFLLVAVGMQRVGRVALHASTNRTASLLALAVTGVLFSIVGFLFLSVLHDYFTTAKKVPWRDIASYVRARAEPGDALVISENYQWDPYDYYARGNELPDTVIPLRSEKANELGYEIRDSNRVWLLASLPDEQQEKFEASLEGAGFKIADQKVYNEGVYPKLNLTLYEKQ